MVALKQVLTEILACFQFLPLSFTAITVARRENVVEKMGCESNIVMMLTWFTFHPKK